MPILCILINGSPWPGGPSIALLALFVLGWESINWKFFAVTIENVKWSIYNQGYLIFIYSPLKEILHQDRVKKFDLF